MKLAGGRIGVLMVISLFVLMSASAAAGGTRFVRGRVLSEDGETLKGAVVQIKNTRSLGIRSYISQKDGRYYFHGLDPDIDYEITARYRGRTSRKKTVSQFNSKETIDMDLIVKDRRPRRARD